MANRRSTRMKRKSSIEDVRVSVDNQFKSWSPQDVCNHLMAKGFKEEAELFKKEGIVGSILGDLNEELLEKMGISQLGKRLQLLQEFRSLKEHQGSFNPMMCHKVFNDPIHGHIEMHPLCIKIIDTPQFQRLRYIKQLGCSYLVFPGAAHNRFEHSLGTIQKRQPELNISEKDVLCVQIAGLCHDLGHGPFSHMFDQCFIPKVRPDSDWKHETASVHMLDYLIEANQLKDVFAEYKLSNQDILFIKEQIAGPQPPTDRSKKNAWPYLGRGEDMSFLYEIVANKRNGIDVDKWDYFLRDCHNLGIPTGFDCHRFMRFSRVIATDGRKQICARDKEVGNLYDMFHTRNSLHRRAYQHKVNKIIEYMMVDALAKANDHWHISGKNGARVKMSDAIDDMVAYSKMTDDIALQIMRSEDPALAESREILDMIQRRQLYKCIGQTRPPEDIMITKDNRPTSEDFLKSVPREELGNPPLTADQLIVHIVDLNYGMGTENPIDYVRFYTKENPNQAVLLRKGQVSQMLPERFAEQQIRVYCKSQNPNTLKTAKQLFLRWCKMNNYAVKAGNTLDPEFTPAKPSKLKRSISVPTCPSTSDLPNKKSTRKLDI